MVMMMMTLIEDDDDYDDYGDGDIKKSQRTKEHQSCFLKAVVVVY